MSPQDIKATTCRMINLDAGIDGAWIHWWLVVFHIDLMSGRTRSTRRCHVGGEYGRGTDSDSGGAPRFQGK